MPTLVVADLSVRDVRTIDDAKLTVHLMLFYEMQSIETMLDSTNDPSARRVDPLRLVLPGAALCTPRLTARAVPRCLQSATSSTRPRPT